MPFRPFGTAAAVLVLFSSATMIFAEQSGDPLAGDKLFKQCSACHKTDADESRRRPLLQGVVGRPAATYSGYPYSEAMRAAAAKGLVWMEEQLAAFLKKPQAMMKGTWMAFPGFGKPKDIRDIIAYLRQHAD